MNAFMRGRCSVEGKLYTCVVVLSSMLDVSGLYWNAGSARRRRIVLIWTDKVASGRIRENIPGVDM